MRLISNTCIARGATYRREFPDGRVIIGASGGTEYGWSPSFLVGDYSKLEELAIKCKMMLLMIRDIDKFAEISMQCVDLWSWFLEHEDDTDPAAEPVQMRPELMIDNFDHLDMEVLPEVMDEFKWWSTWLRAYVCGDQLHFTETWATEYTNDYIYFYWSFQLDKDDELVQQSAQLQGKDFAG